MELKAIKNLNQRIYQLDTDIIRNNKVIFVATLIFAIKLNTEFQNVGKLSQMINFTDENTRPIDQLIKIAKDGIGVVVVTHDMNFAREASDYVAIMHGGTFVEKGRVAEIFENPQQDITKEFLVSDLS